MTKKLNRGRRVALSLLFLLLSLSLLTVSVSADGGSGEADAVAPSPRAAVGSVDTSGGKISYTLPGVPSRSVWAHTRLTLKVNGRTLSEPALVMNGITYLPMRAFLGAFGVNMSYSSASRTATVNSAGLSISVTDGAFVTYANDRALFSFSPATLMSNGRMYVPASALTKAVGIGSGRVTASEAVYSGALKPLTRGSAYYREDELLWLARIISAEARGESLIGQIAVGNVILNRVRSSAFPNTIWGVIFDRRYGVQFSPVANGTIYNDPVYTSVLAAKICLEGTRLSGETLYFLNPRAAHSPWIVNNRKYAYTIINHDFYY